MELFLGLLSLFHNFVYFVCVLNASTPSGTTFKSTHTICQSPSVIRIHTSAESQKVKLTILASKYESCVGSFDQIYATFFLIYQKMVLGQKTQIYNTQFQNNPSHNTQFQNTQCHNTQCDKIPKVKEQLLVFK